jgi:hypothetical protein
VAAHSKLDKASVVFKAFQDIKARVETNALIQVRFASYVEAKLWVFFNALLPGFIEQDCSFAFSCITGYESSTPTARSAVFLVLG